MKRGIKSLVSSRPQPVITEFQNPTILHAGINFSNLIPIPITHDHSRISAIPVIVETGGDRCVTGQSTSNLNKNNLIKVPIINNDLNTPNIRFATWNARSIRAKNKTSALCDLVIGSHLDIVALTETWLFGDYRDDHSIADIQNTLPNYKFHHSHRHHGRGGGTAILVRDGLSVSFNDTCDFASLEYMNVTISSLSASFQLVVLYRPYPSKKNKFTPRMFMDDFSSLLETLTVGSSRLLLAGDFNFHVDDIHDHEATTFLNLLNLHDLQQHVHVPTHVSGHTLDLVISRSDDDLVSGVSVQRGLPSDHYAVKCSVNISRPGLSTVKVRSRRIARINKVDFRSDVQSSLQSTCLPPVSDLASLVSEYNNILTKTLDEHAPIVDRTVVLRPHAPWYCELLHAEKKERRRLERRWLQTGLTVDKDSYKKQCDKYNTLLAKSKTDYHSNQIADADQRDLFRVINKLSSPKATQLLPAHDCPGDLANSFAKFFHDKIKKLRDGLDATAPSPLSVTVTESCASTFNIFSEVSEDDVHRVIKLASITSCSLDPLPVSTFKMCLDALLPVITLIVNSSLSLGVFPAALKHAHVIPLLKKPGLDPNIFSNFRPISNLPFLGKVIERVAVNQLQIYLTNNNLHAPMQSAYRPFHSTETALLKVQNDILTALDKRKEAVLVLLDFSAAFDTIDHAQLINRFIKRYGISGTALQWFSSYLDGRTQSVSIKGALSDPSVLDCSVPQGSVTGPIDFIMFSAPLQDIIVAHGVQFVVYADDTQLYLTFESRDRDVALKKIERCIVDIRSWCSSNRLVLNDKKTEFIYFSSHFSNTSWQPTITIGNSVIQPSSHVRNLGITMDCSLRMITHVNNVCKAALCAIRKIGQIRQYLDQVSTCRLVHAFVTSRLDSCNSLLFGLPDREISKIQHVQNTAARLVLLVPRRDHITPVLRKLHWLPIKQRSAFKILLITFKALHGMAPVFISDLIQKHAPPRALRSSSEVRLRPTVRSSTKFYGDRAFASAAVHLWNCLPVNIRDAPSLSAFKSRLKTYLFLQAFDSG